MFCWLDATRSLTIILSPISIHYRKIKGHRKTDWIFQGLCLPLECYSHLICNLLSWRSKIGHRSCFIYLSCIHVFQGNWLLRSFRRYTMAYLLGCIQFYLHLRERMRISDRIHSILFLPQGILFHLVVSSQVHGCWIGILSGRQTFCNATSECVTQEIYWTREKGRINEKLFKKVCRASSRN